MAVFSSKIKSILADGFGHGWRRQQIDGQAGPNSPPDFRRGD
jgi:hypothetical protein